MHLSPEYAEFIGAIKYHSIRDVLEALEYVQERLAQRDKDRPEQDGDREASRPAIERLERQVEQLSNQLREAPRAPQETESRRLRECFNCGETSHLARDCRAPQAARDQHRRRGDGWQAEAEVPRPSAMPPTGTQRPTSGPRTNEPRTKGRGSQAGHGDRWRMQPAAGRFQIAQRVETLPDEFLELEPARVDEVNRLANFSRPEPSITLDVEIFDEVVSGQVASGATFTCLDYRYYDEKLSKQYDLLANDGLVMQGVDRKPFEVRGIIKLPIKYGDKYGDTQQVTVRAVVLEKLAARLLLGRDFMYNVNMIFDNGARKIYCGEPREPVAAEVQLVNPSIGQLHTVTATMGAGTMEPNDIGKPLGEELDFPKLLKTPRGSRSSGSIMKMSK